MRVTGGSQVFAGVVDEVAARAVGAAALEVELVAEFRLVLGVAAGTFSDFILRVSSRGL